MKFGSFARCTHPGCRPSKVQGTWIDDSQYWRCRCGGSPGASVNNDCASRCSMCNTDRPDPRTSEAPPEPWWGVWAMREGYAGHWHPSGNDSRVHLETTKTEATRVAKALNKFAAERTDSLGWSYEVRPYVRRTNGPNEDDRISFAHLSRPKDADDFDANDTAYAHRPNEALYVTIKGQRHHLWRDEAERAVVALQEALGTRPQEAPTADAAREELSFIVTHLAHHDQDANHAWMVRRIRAVLAGKNPGEVDGWLESDGMPEPRRPPKEKGVTAAKTSLGYRLAIPYAWGTYITITDEEAAALASALDKAGARPDNPTFPEPLPSPLPEWLWIGRVVRCAYGAPTPFAGEAAITKHGHTCVLVKPYDGGDSVWLAPKHLTPSGTWCASVVD